MARGPHGPRALQDATEAHKVDIDSVTIPSHSTVVRIVKEKENNSVIATRMLAHVSTPFDTFI